MTAAFRVNKHLSRGVEVVEVWIDGLMVGTIYPSESGIRLMSRFIDEVELMNGVMGAVTITFEQLE